MQKFSLLFLFLFVLQNLSAQNVNVQTRDALLYPNETCANIWGYAANGKEYALVGAAKGLSIVDVTNPDDISEIVQIPGPNNLWKEIKTLGHYAYVTSEGGSGLQIIDLSGLPDPNVQSKFYTGDGAIAGNLNTIHALHVDTVSAHVYLYGSNIGVGGAVVCDLNDPWNPTYVHTFDDLGYIHDGYVDNDTLYGSHIYAGLMSVVDFTDKTNPVVLGTVTTPNAFTHNTWISEDRTTVFTTDEVDNSFLAAYDVTDPTDLKLLDKIQSNPGSNSMVHNTHIFNNYAVTSWYADGVTIVDITKPTNLVQVGNADIYPGTGGGSNGCWGVYPFLPSGNLIASNINNPSTGGGELHVLTPNYARACYLEGVVTEMGSGLTLPNATIQIVDGDIGTTTKSGLNGDFATGQVTEGTFEVLISKPGYNDATATITLAAGQTTTLDVVLEKGLVYSVGGTTVKAADGTPVPNAHVVLMGTAGNFEGTTDANGNVQFQDVFAGTYDIVGGAWGYEYDAINDVDISTLGNFTLELPKGYRDDFIFDYDWTVTGTSSTGVWERGEPLGINAGFQLVPDADIPGDYGTECYITGNAPVGVGEDGVGDGTMLLTSPSMDLTDYNQPLLRYAAWFTHFTINQQTIDSFKVLVNNGTELKEVAAYPGGSASWRTGVINLKNRIDVTDNMKVIFRCFNSQQFIGFESYEALVDRFFIAEGQPSSAFEPTLQTDLMVRPNPFYQTTSMGWYSELEDPTLLVYDVAGKLLQQQQLAGKEGMEILGEGLPKGMFFVRLQADGKLGKAVRMVKM